MERTQGEDGGISRLTRLTRHTQGTQTMDIQAHEECTGLAPRGERWYAIDHDTYDGCEDGNNREGRGSSAKAAMLDLIERLLDDGEIGHDECRELFRIYHIDPREVGYDG